MPHQDSPAEMQMVLKIIIGKMRAVQKKIGSDSQPASMHELDTLSELGQQYADEVERLQLALKSSEK